MGTVKCIGILTSGGDAPGINTAIECRDTFGYLDGLSVKGIYRGYKGLVTGEIKEFKSQNVSNIIQLGGTILKNRPLQRVHDSRGPPDCLRQHEEGIDALRMIIKGDGFADRCSYLCTRV